MKKIELGQAVGILANLGVIAGILFLAIEIRQNQVSLDEANAINRASSSAAAREYFQDFRALLAQDEQLTAIWLRGLSGAELTPIDQSRFGNVCETLLWAFVAAHRRYAALGQDGEAQAIAYAASGSIRDPGMRDCWDQNRAAVIGNGNETFVNEVERGPESLPASE